MIRFKDDRLNDAYMKDGFVTFPLLNEVQVQVLRDTYYKLKGKHLVHQPILHSTSDTADYELVKEVDSVIQNTILREVDKIIDNYETLIGNFLTKEPGLNSETEYHQDPTLVDETKYISGNIWVALQDTSTINGNLKIVKGSHLVCPNVRATPNCPLFFERFKDELDNYSVEVPLKAGEAVFLNHNTVHGATSNLSNNERIAAVLAIKSKEAPWIFYYWEPGTPVDSVELYSISPESFSRLVKNQRPAHGKLLGRLNPQFRVIDKKEFDVFMNKHYNRSGIFKRFIATFFNH
jgi:ectoine hydroxylase-related dioxygenase (phytanoyl-CoA dioxygenase family)